MAVSRAAAFFALLPLCSAVFVDVTGASGFLASPSELFNSLAADTTRAQNAGVNSTCYASRAAGLAAMVATAPLWDYVNGSGGPDSVHRQYKFDNFRSCYNFMTQAAIVFDVNDHHPVQTNVYNQVDMVFSTDDRKCLSTFDIASARALDLIYVRLTSAPAANSAGGGGGGAQPLGPGATAGVVVAALVCVAALAAGATRHFGAVRFAGPGAAGGEARYGTI